jgi:outer membrane protein OmpA-like peptidoglycan-associated protein
VTSQRSYVVRPTLRSRDERVETIGPENIAPDALVLGHFAFDASVFTTTNAEAIRRVRDAIASGRKVSLVPGADSLGTAEYNDALMLRRAKAAIALLGVRESDVTIDVVRSTPASNATPMGRIANRSVRAIIK